MLRLPPRFFRSSAATSRGGGGLFRRHLATSLHEQRRSSANENSFPALSVLAAAAGAATLLASVQQRQQERDCGRTSRCEVQRTVSLREVVPDGGRLVLSADCGGTTTRLMLYSVDADDAILPKQPAPGTLLREIKYPNIAFKSLKDIIHLFLTQDCGIKDAQPTVAVLALAGIVMNNQCRFTNLDWIVSGHDLENDLKIGKVELINDFVAQGYGMLTLNDSEVIKLNDAVPQQGATIACIGAGTGLGQCFLVADSTGDYRCFPSEGQHGEFGPRGAGSDELQIELLKYLKIKFSGWNRISVERVVSGTGICNIYEFMAYKNPKEVEAKVHKQHLLNPKDAGVIAGNAWPGSLCEKTLKIFASCYGAQCGTMALFVQPFGGLYLTGGVTKRMAEWLLEEGSFLAAYFDKGRLSPLLEKVPLMVVKSDDMGQRGAHLRAVRLLKEEIMHQAERLFAELDVRKEGVLKVDELDTIFKNLEKSDAKLAAMVVKDLDVNKDGQVDFAEFLKGFTKLPNKLIVDSSILHPTESDREEGQMSREELVAPPSRGLDMESQAKLAEVLSQYQSRSRRKYINPFEDRNAAVFRTVLSKLVASGDMAHEDDWLERDYWINKRGAICYHSVTENKALLYCTKNDLANATIEEVKVPSSSLKPWVFRLHPKPQNGTTLAATEFAVSSKEMMDCWVWQLRTLQKEAREEAKQRRGK